MTPVAAEVATTPASGIRIIANAAWALSDAIHLELGEPDFPTPPHIVEAAAAAAHAGQTRYGPSVGTPALRDAICMKLERDNGRPEVRPEQVVVTAGGVGGLFAAYRAVLSAGDEILVPDPGWTNFTTIALMLGVTPIGYRLDPAANFEPDYDRLDVACGPRTRAILINSPSNPVGFQWSAAQLARLGAWAVRRGLVVISDECYDQLWLDEPTTTFAAAAPDTPSITVFSLSKSYAMTGWRLGYVVTSPELATAVGRVQEVTASCVNTVTQYAGVAALTGPQDCVPVMRAAYRRRRDVALATVAARGLRAVRPAGAFYLWLSVTTDGRDTNQLALDLLRTTRTALAPGSAFGSAGEGHLRMSLAARTDDITRGLTHLADFLQHDRG